MFRTIFGRNKNSRPNTFAACDEFQKQFDSTARFWRRWKMSGAERRAWTGYRLGRNETATLKKRVDRKWIWIGPFTMIFFLFSFWVEQWSRIAILFTSLSLIHWWARTALGGLFIVRMFHNWGKSHGFHDQPPVKLPGRYVRRTWCHDMATTIYSGGFLMLFLLHTITTWAPATTRHTRRTHAVCFYFCGYWEDIVKVMIEQWRWWWIGNGLRSAGHTFYDFACQKQTNWLNHLNQTFMKLSFSYQLDQQYCSYTSFYYSRTNWITKW